MAIGHYDIYDDGGYLPGDRVKIRKPIRKRMKLKTNGYVVGIDRGEAYPIRVFLDEFGKFPNGGESFAGFPFSADEIEHTVD